MKTGKFSKNQTTDVPYACESYKGPLHNMLYLNEKTNCSITLILDLERHHDLLNIMNVKTGRTILYFVIPNVNEQLK